MSAAIDSMFTTNAAGDICSAGICLSPAQVQGMVAAALIMAILGFLIGFIAFVLGAAIEEATLAKSILLQMNNPDYTGEKLLPFAKLCFINVLLAVAAAVPTIWLAPEAASSGPATRPCGMLWLALADFDNSAVSNEEVDAELDAWEVQGARIRKEARRLQRET